MSDRENGITQTPWGGQPFATPDVGGTGLNGMGDEFSQGAGSSGIVQTPFSQAIPANGGERTATRDIPAPPAFVNVNGQNAPAGSQLPHDITPRNAGYTIDK